MDLSQLTDAEPELTVTIGGLAFHFSELPIASLAKLQTWINRECQHPLDAIRPHLAGFEPAERKELLEAARLESRGWKPPEVGTKEGAEILLGSTRGQVEVFHQGLLLHQPDITAEQAGAIFRRLSHDSRADKTGAVRRIYAVIFGTAGTAAADEDEQAAETGVPKGPAAVLVLSPGNLCSGPPKLD